MTEIQPGCYRHYKGNEYTVLGVARHSETLEEFVLDQAACLHVLNCLSDGCRFATDPRPRRRRQYHDAEADSGQAFPGRTGPSYRGLQLEARGREFKHGFDLVPGDPRKPLDELIDGRPVFQILEQGPNRNPRVGKYPRAAHLLRVALDRSAFFPGTHGSVSPGDYVAGKTTRPYKRRVNALRVHHQTLRYTPGWARTSNLQLRRLTLYPIELRGHADDRRISATRRPPRRNPTSRMTAGVGAAAGPRQADRRSGGSAEGSARTA